MPEKLPALRVREVVRALERAGFVKWRQKGSHLTMFREGDSRVLTIPVHFSSTIPKGTLHAILKQAGLNKEDFLRFL
jgi:predicted RNA binding protein YcfA (HicA-like mRNA interferase family)